MRFYVLATQAGRLDVAAVLSSLYPVTTVILAVVLLREHVTRSHVLGIILAVAAIGLIAGGSASASASAATSTTPAATQRADQAPRHGDDSMSDPSAPPPIEPTWLVEATYAPDGAETRLPYRSEHIARLQRLKGEGVVVEAGAFLDVSASFVIVRAASEQAALDLCSDDVYLRNGVWVELRARAFGRVRDA